MERQILYINLLFFCVVAFTTGCNETKHATNTQKSISNAALTDQYTGIDFVWVEGGCFQMGSKVTGDEQPIHKVCLDGYWIGQFEITQAQWKKVMGSTPSKFKGSNRPVEQVSWTDAQEFINRLNQKSGKLYRLPTEAEWEFAARGGIKSKGYTYSGSNSINDVAWFGENSGNSTIPVGRKKPNELGIYDMSGNVLEWCQDYYDQSYYRWSPGQNPMGPDDGSSRVFRGGAWYDEPRSIRVADRLRSGADSKGNDLGFRIVLRPVQ